MNWRGVVLDAEVEEAIREAKECTEDAEDWALAADLAEVCAKDGSARTTVEAMRGMTIFDRACEVFERWLLSEAHRASGHTLSWTRRGDGAVEVFASGVGAGMSHFVNASRESGATLAELEARVLIRPRLPRKLFK